MNQILTLIAEKPSRNAVGDTIMVETRRDVWVEELAVGATYKLQAMAAGLRPKYRLKLADCLDYEDEERAEYNGESLKVIDASRKPDLSIELTLEGQV